ncbi:MAG: alpha/beta hydrolase [Anaerolineae bacterium]|nr:alpha/beta hydrolase [Anaerolineae bacterium]
MPAVAAGHGAIHYSDFSSQAQGAGRWPPLLLVHGAGGSRLDWPAALRRLPGARVLTLDLPGHGRSTGPGRATVAGYAQDVRLFLDRLGLERAILVGHSMGGAIAQQVALSDPGRIAGLVLIATGSKLPIDPALPQRILAEPDTTLDWIITHAWGHPLTDGLRAQAHERMAQTPPAVLRGDYLACQSFDARDRLHQIAAPTLIIGAADDRMVPLSFSETLAERIPRATLVVIGGAGHMVPLERAAEVARAITRWLEAEQW